MSTLDETLRAVERGPAPPTAKRDEAGTASLAPGLSLAQFLTVAGQLSLLLLVIRQFQVESNAFLRVAFLAFGGFAMHCFLPMRYRLPFFLLLSLTGIGLVLGFSLGAWLVATGLVLIGICHLPVAFPLRVGLLLAAGAFLAVLRMEWFDAPWTAAIWPVLGSMFMFRLIVYLYDLRSDNAPVSVTRTLSYFFLLPNVCFPLFPVVDFRTFRRNYYSDDAFRTYQVGVEWMVRGIIHLVLYRLIYYHFTLAPSEVNDPVDLVRYLTSNFLLYLRISGQFHLIVGMLYLFGFNLPETNHKYCLASSFTDFWRRINIYWKDFMLKVFYYPAYFRFRKRGTTLALVVSTLFVFVVTWFLHAYQWFWLRGSFLLAWNDVAFWSALAILVLVNSIYEANYAKPRTLSKGSGTLRGSAGIALRTAATFAVICVLWSLWTAESFSAWFDLWPSAVELKGDLGWQAPLLLVVAVLVVIAINSIDAFRNPSGSGSIRPWIHSPAARSIAALALLLVIGTPAVYSRLGSSSATVIHSLRSGTLNRLDTARLQRGYYEELLGVDRFNGQLWEVYSKRPLDWLDVDDAGIARPTGDFLQRELVPSATSFSSRVTVHTNRWGMRDQDYDKEPNPNAFRIAILGSSPVMGFGVEDDQTFESILEARLNREHQGERYTKYEILNFGVSNYKPLQQIMVTERSLSFSPNAVLYVATGGEEYAAARYLAEVIGKRIDVPYAYLRETAKRAGIEATTTETVALRHLRPMSDEILSWAYKQIADSCRDRGVIPIWVHLPMPGETQIDVKRRKIARRAEEAGFVVLDLGELYARRDEKELRVAEWDGHPNASGHRIIAYQLYNALRASEIPLFGPPRTNSEKPSSESLSP